MNISPSSTRQPRGVRFPLENIIESRIAEVRGILSEMEKFPSKTTYFTFLAWIHIWEIMHLVDISDRSEAVKTLWIDAVSGFQSDLRLLNRRNRSIRGLASLRFDSRHPEEFSHD